MKKLYYERVEVKKDADLTFILPINMQPTGEGETQPQAIEVDDIKDLCVRVAGVGETGIGKRIGTEGATRYELDSSEIIVHVAAVDKVGEMSVLVNGKYGQVCLRAKAVAVVGASDATEIELPTYVFDAIAAGGGGDYKTDIYMDGAGRVVLERLEDGSTMLLDEHENPILKRNADGSTQYFDAYQSARVYMNADGTITMNADVEFKDADKLANAITSKGVYTQKTDSIATMAENVLHIPQQVNTKESDFGSFVAPSEYMWNVFEIARDLQKENPHPEMGAFFVTEYYRGYDSLVLTGADAYLTCDGDYYAPLDKTVEVNHIWHDADNGKSNRYVVFYYMQDGYTFSNATASICPRRVALSGRCASFIVSGENRLTDVYVLGTLEYFDGGTTGDSWNKNIVFKIKNHLSGIVFNNANPITSLIFIADDIRSTILKTTQSDLVSARIVCNTISGGNILWDDRTTWGELSFRNLKYVELDATYVGGGARVVYTPYYNYNSLGLIEFYAPLLKKLDTNSYLIYSVDYGAAGNYDEVKKIKLPSLTECLGTIYGGSNTHAYELMDVEVGEMITNLDIRVWNPKNIIADATKLAQLNANIRDHIAAKVSDRTGQSELTFTVSTNLYNNLEQATLDAFTAKNWRVAGA